MTAESLNELVAVDLPSGRILKRLPMPADPENVEWSPLATIVVSSRAGAVTLVDAQRLRVLKTLGGFGSPHIATLVPFPHQRLAYVTDDARGELAVIGLGRRRVLRKVFVGYGAHHMAFSPDGRRLWIALGERARSIAVVDTTSPTWPRLLGHVDPHGLAHDVAFAPSGSAWVTYDDRARIGVFDAKTGRLRRYFPAGSPPQHVVFDQDRAYVTSGNDGTLRIYSLADDHAWLLRVVRIPYGSFNLGLGGSFIVTSSLYRGTLTELQDDGRIYLRKRVAPAARDAAIAVR